MDAVETHRRPRAVPIVAAFLFAATVIAAVVGVSLLYPNPLLDRLWKLNPPAEAAFRAIGRVSGVLLLALAAGTLACGIAMLRRRRWACWFAIALFAINAAGDLVSLAVTGDWARSAAGVLIAGAFLYALTRASVRRYFRSS